MIIFLIILGIIIWMLFAGAWRLGGGVSDWIENEEAKKKERK